MIANGMISVVDELSVFGQAIRTEIVARPSVGNGQIVITIDKAISAGIVLPPEAVSQIKTSIEQGIMSELQNSYGCNQVTAVSAENGELIATCR